MTRKNIVVNNIELVVEMKEKPTTFEKQASLYITSDIEDVNKIIEKSYPTAFKIILIMDIIGNSEMDLINSLAAGGKYKI